MPGVAHELPPVHRGVVDAVVLVFVRRAVVVQRGGALLTLSGREHPRGKKCCRCRQGERGVQEEEEEKKGEEEAIQ